MKVLNVFNEYNELQSIFHVFIFNQLFYIFAKTVTVTQFRIHIVTRLEPALQNSFLMIIL